MVTTRRSVVQLVGLLLIFVCFTQGISLTSYAQSSIVRTKDQYFIFGAVKSPGAYRIERAPSLLRLLDLAGGMTERHGAMAFIVRALPAQADQHPAFNVIQVRIENLLKGSPNSTTDLEPGDIVNIPQGDVFHVAGEVKSPGSFPFTEGLTLLQAIARSGGVTTGAKPGSALIFREDSNTGKRQEIVVDLDAVMSGKQKDIPVLPNDIVMVPSSRTRSLTWPRILDAPPIPALVPCRGSRPCIAQLDLNQSEPAQGKLALPEHR